LVPLSTGQTLLLLGAVFLAGVAVNLVLVAHRQQFMRSEAEHDYLATAVVVCTVAIGVIFFLAPRTKGTPYAAAASTVRNVRVFLTILAIVVVVALAVLYRQWLVFHHRYSHHHHGEDEAADNTAVGTTTTTVIHRKFSHVRREETSSVTTNNTAHVDSAQNYPGQAQGDDTSDEQ
jgi:hypothetical protein